MELILDTINNNKGVISMISLLLGFFIQIYRRFSRNSKHLSYYFSKVHQNQIKVIIWNSGINAIKKSDFPEKGKLTIDGLDSNQQVKISNSTDQYSNITVSKNEDTKVIEFDYLDSSEGISLLISNISDDRQLYIKGKIVNRGKIKSTNIKFWYYVNLILNAILSLIMIQGIALGLFFLIEYYDLDTSYRGTDTWVIFPLYLIIASSVLIIVLTFNRRIKKVYNFANKELEFNEFYPE